MFSEFWDYSYEGSAKKFIDRWYWWATHSRLKPLIDVAKMLKRHFENIVTYLKHRITNALIEGFNSKIHSIKANARGFRNFENYRIAILFNCGKLGLYP
jgi:transposase